MVYPLDEDWDEAVFRRDDRVVRAARAMEPTGGTTVTFGDLLVRMGVSDEVVGTEQASDALVGTEPASAELVGEVATADGHVGRGASRAKSLMAVYGGVVLGGVGILFQLNLLFDLPRVSIIAAFVGLTFFAIACVRLSDAVKPSFETRSGQPYGFALYAGLDVEDIQAAVTEAHTVRAMSVRLKDASITAMNKYRMVRQATKVAWVGAAVLTAAAFTVPMYWLGWLG